MHFKTISLFFILISLSFRLTYATDTIPATDPLIEYTGRIDFLNPDAPKFSYSGVSIRACFTGTSIGVIMDDNVGENYYNVILDGRLLDTIRITTGKKTYPIIDNLENKTHEIELFKRTEERFGKTQFFGFIVDEGASLVSIINKKEKLIEYIGNSITCGYGDEGILGETFGPTTENHYMTYAAITSRNFNARHMAVCISGIGIYRNYDGPEEGNSNCMTNYYTRIFFNNENPKYSFSDKPDLVCINLGTNDFSTNGGDSALFVSNYFRLIDTVQTKYAMPDILCLLGPVLSGPSLAKVRNYLTFIADSANRKGKGNVSFFEMSQQTGDLGFGIDYHPTVDQHIKNGLELTEHIKSLKGWKTNPLIVKADLIEGNLIQLEFNTPIVDSANMYSGFTVFGNDLEYSVDSVYQDSDSDNILYIRILQNMAVKEKVNINYVPGNIWSEDSVMVGSINYLKVTNDLTETIFISGVTNTSGTLVSLTCNKNIKKNSAIEGLTLTDDKQGELAIDSFNIINKKLMLYLNDTILKNDSVFAEYSGSGLYGEDGILLSHFEKLIVKNNAIVTGLNTNELHSILIYPNPNHSGIIYYQMDESLIRKEKITYDIIGSDGKNILSGTVSKTDGYIDLEGNIPNGIYFIKFKCGDFFSSRLIIIE